MEKIYNEHITPESRNLNVFFILFINPPYDSRIILETVKID